MFRWHHKGRDRIPREVLLHGSWDDDHPVRLVPDTEPANANNPERVPRRPAAEEETVFMTIVNLPPGMYLLRTLFYAHRQVNQLERPYLMTNFILNPAL